MSSSAAHTPALPLRELLALPTQPPPESTLPAELWEVGEIEVLSERTSQLHRVLEELSEADLHLPALVAIWNTARRNDPIGQRLLASLLEVRQSGLELLQEMIRPSQSVRCCLKVQRGALEDPRSEETSRHAWGWMAQAGVNRAHVEAQPGRVVDKLYVLAQQNVEKLLQGELHPHHLRWLRGLAETELEARALRLEAMAEAVGAYDGRRISRVLPHLSREEERIRDTRSMMVQWPETDELRRRSPVLMTFLEERYFWKLADALQDSGGRELAHVLRMLASRAPATRHLQFLSAVLREVDALVRPSGSHALDAARALMVTVQIMRPDGSLHLGLTEAEARTLKPLLERLGTSVVDGELVLSYDESRHHALLPADGIPELLPAEKAEVDDIRQLVLDNLQNEHMLSGFLGSPRVVSSPGLLGMVVSRTRSIKILLEISNRRELHTGHANRNVPEALLSHPSNIPTSAIRKFVHVRYVERNALARMANRGTRVRPEVRNMAAAYLKSIGNR